MATLDEIAKTILKSCFVIPFFIQIPYFIGTLLWWYSCRSPQYVCVCLISSFLVAVFCRFYVEVYVLITVSDGTRKWKAISPALQPVVIARKEVR